MMMMDLLETETTVTAWTRTWQIQVDIYLGMTQRPTTTVTDRPAAVDHGRRDVVDERHCAERIRLELHGGLLKAGAAGGPGAGLLVC